MDVEVNKLSYKELLMRIWDLKAIARVQPLTEEQLDQYENYKKQLLQPYGSTFTTVPIELEQSPAFTELATLALSPCRTREQEERKSHLETYLFCPVPQRVDFIAPVVCQSCQALLFEVQHSDFGDCVRFLKKLANSNACSLSLHQAIAVLNGYNHCDSSNWTTYKPSWDTSKTFVRRPEDSFVTTELLNEFETIAIAEKYIREAK